MSLGDTNNEGDSLWTGNRLTAILALAGVLSQGWESLYFWGFPWKCWQADRCPVLQGKIQR